MTTKMEIGVTSNSADPLEEEPEADAQGQGSGACCPPELTIWKKDQTRQ